MLQRMAKWIQKSISSGASSSHAYGKLQLTADADTLSTDALTIENSLDLARISLETETGNLSYFLAQRLSFISSACSPRPVGSKNRTRLLFLFLCFTQISRIVVSKNSFVAAVHNLHMLFVFVSTSAPILHGQKQWFKKRWQICFWRTIRS